MINDLWTLDGHKKAVSVNRLACGTENCTFAGIIAASRRKAWTSTHGGITPESRSPAHCASTQHRTGNCCCDTLANTTALRTRLYPGRRVPDSTDYLGSRSECFNSLNSDSNLNERISLQDILVECNTKCSHWGWQTVLLIVSAELFLGSTLPRQSERRPKKISLNNFTCNMLS